MDVGLRRAEQQIRRFERYIRNIELFIVQLEEPPIRRRRVYNRILITNERLYQCGSQRFRMIMLPNSNETCSICLESFHPPHNINRRRGGFNILQATRCNHFFCRDCMHNFIRQWTQQHDLTCPICRNILFRAEAFGRAAREL